MQTEIRICKAWHQNDPAGIGITLIHAEVFVGILGECSLLQAADVLETDASEGQEPVLVIGTHYTNVT